MSVGSPASVDRLDRSPRLRSWPLRERIHPATAAVVGLAGLGAALRFHGLSRQGFWFDEANTAQLVRYSPGKMLGLIPRSESTPPLYYWRPRLIGAAATVALCAIGVIATAGINADRSLQRPDWRAVARSLGPAPVRGPGRAILVQHYRTLLPLSLYLPRLKMLGRAGSPVTQLDVIATSSPAHPLCWWGAACNLIPSRMQATYDVSGFHAVWLRHEHQFTIMQLDSRRSVHLTRAAVASALTTTSLRRDVLLVQLTKAPGSPPP